MLRKISIVLLLLSFAIGNSQITKVDKANKKYKALAFIDAQKIYLNLVEEGYASADILSKLGDTYYFNDDLTKAHKWYELLFEDYEEVVKPEYFFRYAQSLKSLKKYQESDRLMSKFNTLKGFDSRSNLYSEEPNYLQIIDFQSGRFKIENTQKINSNTVEFGPAFDKTKKRVIFATARDSGSLIQRKHTWSDQPFLQLFSAEADEEGKLSNPKKLSRVINTKFHESTPCISADGNTMYFTRNNYADGVYKQDVNGINKLKIFVSNRADNIWSKPVSLPFNNDEYSVAHPALSPDGKKLYFASDMPGVVGYDVDDEFTKSDIWVVDVLADGAYGKPVNIKSINTSGRESFPFVSENNVLYFASSGHQGLGGLDVFASSINTDGTMSKVVNLGAPINTPDDDFAFIVNDESKIGYFTSNRPGGAGGDDIYRFLQLEDLRNPCEMILTGVVSDKNSGEPMDQSTVFILDADNKRVNELVTGVDGKYSFKLECDRRYIVRGEKEAYSSEESVFTTPSKSGALNIPLQLENSVIEVMECDDIGPLLGIENIYFDFDRFNIRNDAAFELAKIKAFMELYPETSVEIRSHTDSRADDDYNLILSKKRAQSTLNWLVSNGIAASRLSAIGCGESRLLNDCSNEVACSEEAHQLNRRSEFIVQGLERFKDCD